MDDGENLTRQERIRARHVLQEVAEYCRSLQDALDPNHGVPWAHRDNFELDVDNLITKLAALKGPVITTSGDTGTEPDPASTEESRLDPKDGSMPDGSLPH